MIRVQAVLPSAMEWFILRYPIVCFNIPQVLLVCQYASFLYYSYSPLQSYTTKDLPVFRVYQKNYNIKILSKKQQYCNGGWKK